MIHLIDKYAIQENFNERKIIITENPKHIYDLQFLLHTRLFFFKNSGGYFYIDFNRQDVKANTIYIVPPLHFQHLSKNTFEDFVCIDIDNTLLKSYHRQLLYFIKFNKNKSIKVDTSCVIHYKYEILTQLLSNCGNKESLLIDTIYEWIKNAAPISLTSKIKNKPSKQIEDADTFLSLLEHIDLNFDACRVNLLASKMFMTERNLHRVCRNNFGICAKEVVKYQITTKAIYLLTQSSMTISDIALNLNFSTTSVFARYIRLVTGSTPSEIRNTFSI